MTEQGKSYEWMIGKRFFTPYPETQGVVTVLAIEPPHYPFDVPLASVRYEGDHLAGYKDGTYGMYEAFMLVDLPVEESSAGLGKKEN